MVMEAAVSRKPVAKPYSTPSHSALENGVSDDDSARTAPTKTANPIITQLTGRISRTKPLVFPMTIRTLFKEALVSTQLIKFSIRMPKNGVALSSGARLLRLPTFKKQIAKAGFPTRNNWKFNAL